MTLNDKRKKSVECFGLLYTSLLYMFLYINIKYHKNIAYIDRFCECKYIFNLAYVWKKLEFLFRVHKEVCHGSGYFVLITTL